MLLVPQQGGEMANNASSSSCFPYPYPYPSEASPVAPATDAGAYGTSAPSVDSHTVCSPVASETHDSENKRKSRDEASLMITGELKVTTTDLHRLFDHLAKFFFFLSLEYQGGGNQETEETERRAKENRGEET